MEESKPSAEFGGTNGKGIPSNGCLFFLPHLNTCQDSQMLKKTQINTNASQRDGIVLIPYPNIIMELLYLWVHFCPFLVHHHPITGKWWMIPNQRTYPNHTSINKTLTHLYKIGDAIHNPTQWPPFNTKHWFWHTYLIKLDASVDN